MMTLENHISQLIVYTFLRSLRVFFWLITLTSLKHNIGLKLTPENSYIFAKE